VTAEERAADLVSDLLEPIPRTAIVPAVRAALGLSQKLSDRIVQAFDDFVAKPLEANLKKLHGRDLAKRNPMIYTVRGTDAAEEWAERVLADKETSAIEAHIGTWLEEVARIVSGGIKPGNGVDLQTQDANGVVQLYAIQSAPNTKNAGGRKSDIEALRRGARPLRGHRQRVELNIAVLGGRAKTGPLRSQSDISVLSSDDFWERISGIADFRARLLRASTILARKRTTHGARGETGAARARSRRDARLLVALVAQRHFTQARERVRPAPNEPVPSTAKARRPGACRSTRRSTHA
jgi:hypothetical protein